MTEFFAHSSSWALLFSFFFGLLAIIFGNGVYPYLKENEAKQEKLFEEQKAKKEKVVALKQMLSDEILRNIRLSHRILKSLNSGSISITPIETTALDSVISTGLSQSLEPRFFKKLINAGYTVNQAKHVHKVLSDIMISRSTVARRQRSGIENELKPYLIVSKSLLLDIFKEFELEKFLTYPDEAQDLFKELEEK